MPLITQPERESRPTPHPAAPADRSADVRAGTLRILIACSEPALAAAVRGLLEREPAALGAARAAARCAFHGVACLQQLELAPPELLVLEHGLPGLPGDRLLEAARASRTEVILLVPAWERPAHPPPGVHAVLEVPLQPGALEDAVAARVATGADRP